MILVVDEWLIALQMWVSVDDWHENPDIIHTRFT